MLESTGNRSPRMRNTASRERGSPNVFLVGGSIEPADVALEDVPDLVHRTRRKDEFVWLHLVEPEEDTVREARDVLGIHPTAVADVVSRRQQPKVQKFDEHLFVMLWNVLRLPDESLLLGETYLYIGEGWLLTVQRGNGAELPDLRKLLDEAPDDARADTLPAAYRVMAQIVDGYAKAAADIETALEELEEQVFSDDGREDHTASIGSERTSVASTVPSRASPRPCMRAPGIWRPSPSATSRSCRTCMTCSTTPPERPRSSTIRARASTPSSRATRTTSPPGRTRTCAPSPHSPPFSPCPRSSQGSTG